MDAMKVRNGALVVLECGIRGSARRRNRSGRKCTKVMRSHDVAKRRIVTARIAESRESRSQQISVAGTGEAEPACPYTATKQVFRSWKSSLKREPQPGDVLEDGTLKPPGPFGDPLQYMADLFVIATKGMERATLHFADTYGPIARFPNPSGINGASGWTFLNDPDLLQYCCQEKVSNYTERYLPDIYTYVTGGKGILGSAGAYNKAQRRLCMPPFQKKASLVSFSAAVIDRASILLSIWDEEDDFVVDMAVQMQRLTLDIVGVVAFSHDFKQLAGMAEHGPQAKESEIPTDRVLHDINVAQDIMGRIFVTPMPVLKFLKAIKAPFMLKMEGALNDMKDAVMPTIRERREAKARGEVKEDLLNSLLEMQAELQANGEGFTDEELWEDVHDVMGAGHETTASTLTACLYTLSKHPEVERKLHEELDAVLGGRLPTYEDFDQLVYTKQVVKEVLRLYPPIPIFPRLTKDDDVLPSGHKVPAGEVIFMSSYAMGRSEDIWNDPLVFDPSRFDEHLEAERHRFQWVPFGGGPRMCMGAGFAMLSTTLVLATLTQKYKFETLKDMGKVVPIEYDITMYFPDTVDMRVCPRS